MDSLLATVAAASTAFSWKVPTLAGSALETSALAACMWLAQALGMPAMPVAAPPSHEASNAGSLKAAAPPMIA